MAPIFCLCDVMDFLATGGLDYSGSCSGGDDNNFQSGSLNMGAISVDLMFRIEDGLSYE